MIDSSRLCSQGCVLNIVNGSLGLSSKSLSSFFEVALTRCTHISQAMAATKMQGRGPPAGNIELYSGTYFGACALGGVIGQLGAFRHASNAFGWDCGVHG